MDLGETVGKILIFCNVPQQTHHAQSASEKALTSVELERLN